MQEQKNSGVDSRLIVGLAVVAAAYYGLLRPITDFLGLTDDTKTKEQKEFNDLVTNADYWSPNFYIDLNRQTTLCLLRYGTVTDIADKISAAFGILNDDEEAIYANIRRLRSKAQVSQLAQRFAEMYNKDLLQTLKDYLSVSEFNIVAKIVNDLPVNYTC